MIKTQFIITTLRKYAYKIRIYFLEKERSEEKIENFCLFVKTTKIVFKLY